MKKTLLYLLFIVLSLIMLCPYASASECTVFEGSNASAQNYTVWSKPIKSNLVLTDEGQLMRVQYVTSLGRVQVEYYDRSFNFLSSKILDSELSLFGGFFACDNGYYIVTGKRNLRESNDAEVIRITKYDKSWNRITSASLYGENTTIPFDTGAVRFSKSDKYIIIRTCHEMYNNGENDNRANLTIQLDSESMTVTSCLSSSKYGPGYGCVTHSSNQFVLIDNDNIVSLDHGDSSPRSIVLIKYKTKVSSGQFIPRYNNTGTCIDMFYIAGEKGDNYTNCSVGAFEMSSSAYIAAICSIDQKTGSSVKNIYVSSLSKTADTPVVSRITDYTDNTENCSTPHLVKFGKNRFVLLWQKGKNICYCRLDRNGSLDSEIYSIKGELSDCKPIISGGKITWYVWNNDMLDFYEIKFDDLSDTKKTPVSTDHDYKFYSCSGTTATLKCSKCSKIKNGSIPTDFNLAWRKRDSNIEYSFTPYDLYHPDENVKLLVRRTLADCNEYKITSSNEAVVKIDDDGTGSPLAQMIGEGEAIVTVCSAYNSQFKSEYTVKVGHTWSETGDPPTCTKDGSVVKACTVCKKSVSETVYALGHDYSDYTITKAPTCKALGEKTAVCSRCNRIVNESIPRIDHDKNITVPASNATCEKSGKTDGKKCSMCGTITVQQETIPALGHDYGEYVTTKDPTCTAQGKQTATCSRCGETTSKSIAKIAHDEKTIVKGSNATCEKSGKTDGKKCSMCGAITVQQETIPALGHSYGEYVTTKDPTCTAQGKQTATCSRCGETTSKSIAKIDHDKKTTVKGSNATCEKSGKTDGKKCSMCGAITVQQETIPALGHDYGEYVTTKAPTCTAQGKQTATCSRCGETTSKSIAKIDHDKKTVVKGSSATCEKAGKTDGKKCSMCGAVTVQQETIPALGHDYGKYVTTKDPTCTAQGKQTATCSRCGETTSKSIAKIAHDEKTIVKGSNATCEKAGKTDGKKCSMCGTITVQQETIPALGHDYGKYVTTKDPTCTAQGKQTATCSRCGETTSKSIAKIAHDEKTIVKGSSATCEKAGKTDGKKCSMCGTITVQQETIPALGHSYGEYVTTKDPTCTAQGKQTATCSRCGETTSKSIAKIDHDKKTTVKGSSATCEKAGKTDGKKCSMCGTITVQQETIPALGHDYGEYVTTKDPTCTAQGKQTATCSRCGETTSKSIAKIAHDEKTIVKGSNATCEKSGKTDGKKCSMCGTITVQQETIPALGHDYGEYVTTKDPTCTAQGKQTATCSRCGEEKTQAVNKLGHSYNEYEVTKEPTCTAKGTKTAYCIRCNQTVTEDIEKVPHEKTVIKETKATCTKGGKTEGAKCIVCGKVLEEQQATAKLGHSYKTTVITKATMENHGETKTKCSRCGVESTKKVYMIKTVKLTKTKYAYTGKSPVLSVSVVDSQKNALKKGTDYTVSVGSAKKIGTYTAKITFKGKYSGSKKLSFTIVTGKVSKITGSAGTAQIKLTWSNVTGATGYRVYQYDSQSGKYKALANVTKNTYTVKKLKSGSKYKFAIKAYTRVSDSKTDWGSSATVQLATKPIKANLTAKAVSGGVNLSWQKVSGASGYQVYYSTSKNGKYEKLKTTTALSFKNTQLQKGKTYYFKVRAYTKAEGGVSYGAFSDIKSVKVK